FPATIGLSKAQRAQLATAINLFLIADYPLVFNWNDMLDCRIFISRPITTPRMLEQYLQIRNRSSAAELEFTESLLHKIHTRALLEAKTVEFRSMSVLDS